MSRGRPGTPTERLGARIANSALMSEIETTGMSRLAELRASARGWHGVQLAVLGFIGLCGVLKDRQSSDPRLLQWAAGLLAVAALAVGCFATYLVARAAWPLYGPGRT